MQLSFVLLLSLILCGRCSFKRLDLAFTCLFFCAMMQTCGFSHSIGLITPSITYSFFYALPLIFLILYLLPFIFKEFYGKRLIRNRIAEALYGLLFLLLSCFSGAINPAVSLVAVLTLLIRYFHDYRAANGSLAHALRKMPRHYLRFLLPLGVLSLYA